MSSTTRLATATISFLLVAAVPVTWAQTEVVNAPGTSLNVTVGNSLAQPIPVFGGALVANFPGTAINVNVENPPALQTTQDLDRAVNGIYQHNSSMSMPAGSTSVVFTYPNVPLGSALILEYVSVRLPPSVPQTGTANCLLITETPSGPARFYLPVRVTPGGGILRPIIAEKVTAYHVDTASAPSISCAFSSSMSLDNANATLVGHMVDL